MEEYRPVRGLVIQRDEAESYWQPAPSHGSMNTILTPKNCPSNAMTIACQYIDKDCVIRPHAHRVAEEVLYIVEGNGTFVIEGRRYPAVPGTTALVGRYVKHELLNEGAGTLKVLAVLFPPGTEVAWRAMGRVRRAGQPAPARYGREGIPNLQEITDDAGFARAEVLTTLAAERKGAAMVLQPEEGTSFWQPQPVGGHVTFKLWHDTMPSNMFAFGTQSLPPKGRSRETMLTRAETAIFVTHGRGVAVVDGVSHQIAPETLVWANRDARLEILNDGSEDLSWAWVLTPPGAEEVWARTGMSRRNGEARPPAIPAPADLARTASRFGVMIGER